MEIMRLIVTGATGAGKSTFIRSASEIQVVKAARIATEQTSFLNPKTTTSFNFGRLNFNSDMAIHLYGTPGLASFDFMWELLIRRSHAYILLVAANRLGDIRQARRLLAFMNHQVQVPMIIGLTHTDYPGALSKEDVTIALGYGNQRKRPIIVRVDPTQKTSVIQTLITLVEKFGRTSSAGYRMEKSLAA